MFREDQENRPVASFTSKNFDMQSALSKGASELESDPNSVSIIRDLLKSDSEWSDVPEICKLTFTAFYNVVSAHAASIREIENVLPMKANKVDVHSLLNTKANVKDIRVTVSDMAQEIEARVTADEVRRMIDTRLDTGASARGKLVLVIIFIRSKKTISKLYTTTGGSTGSDDRII